MGKKTDTKALDLATLSPEELLAWAKNAEAQLAEGIEKIETLEKELGELNKKVEKFEKDLEEALEENSNLQEKLEEAPVKGELPTVTHAGKKFSVQIPSFKYKGAIYNAEALSKNKELVAELIEINSGVLKPL